MQWILLIISLLIALAADGYIKYTYNSSIKIKNKKALTGQEIADKILKANKLNIYTVQTRGKMTDHYDGARRVIRLSEGVFSTATIASTAIAAHEAAHAIQDKENYWLYNIRKVIAPVAGFASNISYVVIIIGIFSGLLNLLYLGILLLMLVLIFQLVTLPLEIDASSRAIVELKKLSLIDEKEEMLVAKMLKAAAFTYVAAVINSVLEIVRLMLMSRD